MGNHDWTRDEHILALDVYVQNPDARNSKTHQAVIELSLFLNKLSIHPTAARNAEFRNPNGVGMKLANFKRLDATYQGAGLPRGAKLEEEVWNEFAHDPDSLHEVALAIRSLSASVTAEDIDANILSDDEVALEGKVLTVTHSRRERNQTIVNKKKRQVFQLTGALQCEACGFDFSDTYGRHGKGFAECHHELPLSELAAQRATRLSDLRILCANCHRMIHRSRPWITVGDLRRVLAANGK